MIENEKNRQREVTKEDVKGAVQAVLDVQKGFSGEGEEKFFGLDRKDLELARIWCWQNLSAYTADAVLELYEFIQESSEDGLALGPTAFRFCKTVEEIRAQHKRTKEILGDHVELFTEGEKIDIQKIDEYEIKMHKHDCDFGAGLICLSMWRAEREVFQVSCYPTEPLKIYEIKGGKSFGDGRESRERKQDHHRFSTKYQLAPSSALIVMWMSIAQEMGVDVEVAGWASLWRNYGIAGNRTKREQANAVYRKVKQELGLKYDECTEAIIETIETMNRLSAEEVISELEAVLKRNAHLFEGGADEFLTKLLFSSYADEYLQADLGMLWEREKMNDSSLQKKEWLRFYLPLFMRVGGKQRDDILAKYLPLIEKT